MICASSRCGVTRLFAALLLLSLPVLASAQTCRVMKMTEVAFAGWFNPRPSPDDFVLPMPLGLSLVFVPVPLGTTGLYGDEKTTYTMGASQPTMFETPLEVRVGSSILDLRGQSRLLVGKYEVTKAQYAAVMGRGDLLKGLMILRQRTKETRVHRELDKYLDDRSACRGKMTDSLHRMLAEPLTFLSYRDYVEFLDTYNLFCVFRNDCRNVLQSLGANRDVPGFVRLPSEHEWEFVARGGGELVSGRLGKRDVQRDLPTFPAGKTISAYAHADNDPPVVLPIGSREPLFGFHDMYGNAQELMGNAFTAENGFGAVGGYVARGGHFGLDHAELRASRRVELTAFRTDDTTGMLDIQYFPRTGIRLAVGLPVAGAAQRLGDNSLAEDFARNYVVPGQAGDTAGDTQSEARALGNLGTQPLEISEELGGDDAEDWYQMALRNYGSIQVNVEGGQGLAFEILDARQEILGRSSSSTMTIRTKNLLPGDYWLHVRARSGRLSSKVGYKAVVRRSLAADTGIVRPDASALSSAFPIDAGSVLQKDGFVGRGDTIDTYPIRNRSQHSGLMVELDAYASLTVSLLDDRLQLIQRETITPNGGSGRALLAMPLGMRGFLQIESDSSAQSVYKVRARAKAPIAPVFLTEYPRSPSTVRQFARSNETYEGTISGRQKIYLPIRLTERRVVRLELSELDADVSMAVTGRARRVVSSSHGRSGTQPEFFSKTLEAGTYIVSLGLENRSETSTFKLAYSTEAPDIAVSRSDVLRTEARNGATDIGVLSRTKVPRFKLLSGEFTYFRFRIRGPSEQRVVLSSEAILSGGIGMALESFSGTTLAKSTNVGVWEERIVATLAPGTYYILMTLDGARTGTLDHVVALEAFVDDRMQEPDLSGFGTFMRRHGSFMVYRNRTLSGSSDDCTAVTLATAASPLHGWRLWKPHLAVTVRPGESGVTFSLDRSVERDGSDLYRPGSMTGTVLSQGDIPLEWEDQLLWPSVPCDDGSNEYCIDGDAPEKFSKGHRLFLRGRTNDGMPASVTYSLSGYTAAMQSINRLCAADADWLWQG